MHRQIICVSHSALFNWYQLMVYQINVGRIFVGCNAELWMNTWLYDWCKEIKHLLFASNHHSNINASTGQAYYPFHLDQIIHDDLLSAQHQNSIILLRCHFDMSHVVIVLCTFCDSNNNGIQLYPWWQNIIAEIVSLTWFELLWVEYYVQHM